MKRTAVFLLVVLVMVLSICASSMAATLGAIAPGEIPAWAVGQETEITNKIVAEFNAQASAGFDFGTPWQDVKGWENVIVFQPFNGGDNQGNLWGWGTVDSVVVGAGFIMLSEGADRAYSLINEMSEAWGNLGHFGVVGYPTSNQFEVDGKIYQNFSLCYLECDPGNSASAVVHAGEVKVNPADETPTEAPTSEPTAEPTSGENPSTADPASAVLVLAALSGLVGMVAVRSRKR